MHTCVGKILQNNAVTSFILKTFDGWLFNEPNKFPPNEERCKISVPKIGLFYTGRPIFIWFIEWNKDFLRYAWCVFDVLHYSLRLIAYQHFGSFLNCSISKNFHIGSFFWKFLNWFVLFKQLSADVKNTTLYLCWRLFGYLISKCCAHILQVKMFWNLYLN